MARCDFCGFVDLDVAAHDDFGVELGEGAAQQSADARDQFFHGEGLGDVVIGAGVESFDAIGFFAACGEDDDRHGFESQIASQALADVDAGWTGQHPVKEQEVGGWRFGGLEESLASIGGASDGEALAFERIGEEVDERGFVFGDEDQRRGHRLFHLFGIDFFAFGAIIGRRLAG